MIFGLLQPLAFALHVITLEHEPAVGKRRSNPALERAESMQLDRLIPKNDGWSISTPSRQYALRFDSPVRLRARLSGSGPISRCQGSNCNQAGLVGCAGLVAPAR